MKINKKMREYLDRYGKIPKDHKERIEYLINELRLKPSDLGKIRDKIQGILDIRQKQISFIFYFTPDATPRARYSRFTKAFYVKNALDYKSIFSEFVESCGDLDYITTPCEFHCKTFKPTPKAMNRHETFIAELGLIKDVSKPDWDNLGKTYSDMVQSKLLMDDFLIYKGTVEKFYSIRPRIEITIKYYTTHDSTYNQNRILSILNRKGESNNANQ